MKELMAVQPTKLSIGTGMSWKGRGRNVTAPRKPIMTGKRLIESSDTLCATEETKSWPMKPEPLTKRPKLALTTNKLLPRITMKGKMKM